jgi:hypothetical protein
LAASLSSRIFFILYSNAFFRKKNFEFKIFNPSLVSRYVSNQIYQLGILGDTNAESGIIIENVFIDCNGDGLVDYFVDSSNRWKGYNVTVFEEYFFCSMPQGVVTISGGMTLKRDGGWDNSSFIICRDSVDDYCVVRKSYQVMVY